MQDNNNNNVDQTQSTPQSAPPITPPPVAVEPSEQTSQQPDSSQQTKGMRRLGILFIIELSLLVVTMILGYVLFAIDANAKGPSFSGILLIPFVFVLSILALVMTVLCVMVIRSRGSIRGLSWWFYVATLLNGAFTLLVLWRMVYSAVL